METKAVHLKLTKKMYEEVEKLTKEFGFTSIQELIRDATRKVIQEYHKQSALIYLKKLKGSDSNVKQLTRADKDKIAKEYLKDPDTGNKLMREWGFL